MMRPSRCPASDRPTAEGASFANRKVDEGLLDPRHVPSRLTVLASSNGRSRRVSHASRTAIIRAVRAVVATRLSSASLPGPSSAAREPAGLSAESGEDVGERLMEAG